MDRKRRNNNLEFGRDNDRRDRRNLEFGTDINRNRSNVGVGTQRNTTLSNNMNPQNQNNTGSALNTEFGRDLDRDSDRRNFELERDNDQRDRRNLEIAEERCPNCQERNRR